MLAPAVLLAAARLECLGREHLLEYQAHRLRRLIRRAYLGSVLYREKFDAAGISPEAVRKAADLAALPLTTRRDFRARPHSEVLAAGVRADSLKLFRTTGSTGEPFIVRRTRAEDFAFHVFRWRAMRSYGLRPTDRMARIGTHAHRLSPAAWRTAQQVGLYRQAQVDILDSPEKIAAALERLRADVVTGNGGVLARISRDFRGGYAAGGGPRFVVTGSDLTTPAMRAGISRAFGCPVYDTYASEELGLIAWQCRVTGLYHVCEDSLVLEVLKPDGIQAREGERGEVVATALHFETMPFIRYRLGDEVTVGPAPCPCGSPYGTISEILGRMTDFLRLPGGREVFANIVAVVIQDGAPWVGRYEFVQEREDRVELRVVPLSPPGPDVLADLKKRIGAQLGPGVDLRLEIVPDIVRGPGGKYRVLRSKLDSPYDREA